METDRFQALITLLQAYQETLNQGDVEAAITLFHEDGSIDDEGIQLPVRPFHEYEVGAQSQIRLSDFRSQGETITCLYHCVSALDRVLDHEGKPRTVQFRFQGERVAKLVIFSSGVQEAIFLHEMSAPFFTWVKEHHPEQYRIMSTLTSEGGKALAALTSQWRTSQSETLKDSP